MRRSDVPVRVPLHVLLPRRVHLIEQRLIFVYSCATRNCRFLHEIRSSEHSKKFILSANDLFMAFEHATRQAPFRRSSHKGKPESNGHDHHHTTVVNNSRFNSSVTTSHAPSRMDASVSCKVAGRYSSACMSFTNLPRADWACPEGSKTETRVFLPFIFSLISTPQTETIFLVTCFDARAPSRDVLL